MKKTILTLAVLCACLFLLCGTATAEAETAAAESSFQLPAGLRILSDEVFAGTAIESVTITDGVQIIGQGAFADTPGLTSIDLPANITIPGTAEKIKHPHLTAGNGRTLSKPEAEDARKADAAEIGEDTVLPSRGETNDTDNGQLIRAETIPGQQLLPPETPHKLSTRNDRGNCRSMRPQDRAELHDIRVYFP